MSTVAGGRNVVLGGLMGTGKTTIARLLARSLGRQWIDTDERIAQAAGAPIAELFAREGESAFRRREAAAVAALAEADGLVISLGGGVLLDPDSVARLRATGVIVLLTGDVVELGARAARRGLEHRPLLAEGDPVARLRELAMQRRAAYEAAADHIEDTTDGRGPEQVAQSILSWMATRDDVLTPAERERVAA